MPLEKFIVVIFLYYNILESLTYYDILIGVDQGSNATSGLFAHADFGASRQNAGDGNDSIFVRICNAAGFVQGFPAFQVKICLV
uniref:hypothetical protein n=1 Tax=Castellaniella defragrans TaxID=75697 RepID=UPI0033429DBE